MRLLLQPLVDALRQHVASGFASAFHTAVLAATPSVDHVQDHATGDALLRALLGCAPATTLPLVKVYVVHEGQWVGLDPADLAERQAATEMPTSLAEALSAPLCAGAQAHWRDATCIIDTIELTEAEGLTAAMVNLRLVTSSGFYRNALAFGATGATPALRKTTKITGAALYAAGEQARQHTDGGLLGVLNDIQLSMPAASGAIN